MYQKIIRHLSLEKANLLSISCFYSNAANDDAVIYWGASHELITVLNDKDHYTFKAESM
jgi:hypothetical protein